MLSRVVSALPMAKEPCTLCWSLIHRRPLSSVTTTSWPLALWGGIVGTVICAFFVGGWIALMGYAPFMTLFTTVLISDVPPNLIIAPLICIWLFDRVKARGLYWRERIGEEEPAPA
jgi:hypothetical protein